jgi:hypothetical protein
MIQGCQIFSVQHTKNGKNVDVPKRGYIHATLGEKYIKTGKIYTKTGKMYTKTGKICIK